MFNKHVENQARAASFSSRSVIATAPPLDWVVVAVGVVVSAD